MLRKLRFLRQNEKQTATHFLGSHIKSFMSIYRSCNFLFFNPNNKIKKKSNIAGAPQNRDFSPSLFPRTSSSLFTVQIRSSIFTKRRFRGHRIPDPVTKNISLYQLRYPSEIRTRTGWIKSVKRIFLAQFCVHPSPQVSARLDSLHCRFLSKSVTF